MLTSFFTLLIRQENLANVSKENIIFCNSRHAPFYINQILRSQNYDNLFPYDKQTNIKFTHKALADAFSNWQKVKTI